MTGLEGTQVDITLDDVIVQQSPPRWDQSEPCGSADQAWVSAVRTAAVVEVHRVSTLVLKSPRPRRQAGSGAALADEAGGDNDTGEVLAAQADLVDAVHTLRAVLNYRGVEADQGSRR